MDTRPTTRLGDIVFERFSHPPLDTSSESRTATHEPIGAPTVTDHLGSKAREFTMVGHCDPSTASDIDDLAEQSEHNLRHARHSGPVIVLSADTESDGAFIDTEDGILRYTYTIKMKEVQ